MTRRADRRRADLQRHLLFGPASLADLARAVRRSCLLVRADLAALQETGAVVLEWMPRPGGAGLFAYRVPTLAERSAREAARAALEQRVRAALHWIADSVELTEGSK